MHRLVALRPGTDLVSTTNGCRAVDMAREHCPQLILLDLHLPGMGGREVLAALKACPDTAGIPVVIVSADAWGDTARRLMEAGAADYLGKPYDLDEFLGLLERMLGPAKEAGH